MDADCRGATSSSSHCALQDHIAQPHNMNWATLPMWVSAGYARNQKLEDFLLSDPLLETVVRAVLRVPADW